MGTYWSDYLEEIRVSGLDLAFKIVNILYHEYFKQPELILHPKIQHNAWLKTYQLLLFIEDGIKTQNVFPIGEYRGFQELNIELSAVVLIEDVQRNVWKEYKIKHLLAMHWKPIEKKMQVEDSIFIRQITENIRNRRYFFEPKKDYYIEHIEKRYAEAKERLKQARATLTLFVDPLKTVTWLASTAKGKKFLPQSLLSTLELYFQDNSQPEQNTEDSPAQEQAETSLQIPQQQIESPKDFIRKLKNEGLPDGQILLNTYLYFDKIVPQWKCKALLDGEDIVQVENNESERKRLTTGYQRAVKPYK